MVAESDFSTLFTHFEYYSLKSPECGVQSLVEQVSCLDFELVAPWTWRKLFTTHHSTTQNYDPPKSKHSVNFINLFQMSRVYTKLVRYMVSRLISLEFMEY